MSNKVKHHVSMGLSLPKKMFDRIERDRGDVGRSRFILRILEKHYGLD